MRATPGVELVRDGAYSRTFSLGGTSGVIEVSLDPGGDCLSLRVPTELTGLAEPLKARVERIFDLTAPPAVIKGHLGNDPVLASAAAAFPGVRVPGAWCSFELAVRAILGQRVSVKSATSLAGRLVARLGEELRPEELRPPAQAGLTHLFPTAERLASADLSGLGLTGQKMTTLRSLARAVTDGRLRLDRFSQGEQLDLAEQTLAAPSLARSSPAEPSLENVDLETAVTRLQELPGIGPWTAHYIAMRALRKPDAFPAGDLILRRAAAPTAGTTLTETELATVAERWRPCRAYAAMLLWASYSQAQHKAAQARSPGNK